MTTPLEIIKLSMKDAGALGVGESLQAEDVNDAFRKLNWMVAEWAKQRWLIYHLVEKTIVATGSPTYTVGPGGDIVLSPRPSAIQSAVLVQQPVGGYPVDYALDVIYAFEDWQRIAVKTLVGPPTTVFLDTAYPVGTIHVWPVPQAGLYTMKFLFQAPLSGFSSLTEQINLPAEYESALNWNLAKRLTPMTGDGAVNPIILAQAANSLKVIRSTNAQVRRLQMPRGLSRRPFFNVFSGTWY